MSLLHALILAIIQGITEFLPVSSKSHMALYQLWVGGGKPDVAFEFALHIGTIASTLVYFRRDLLPVLQNRHEMTMLFLTSCFMLLAYPLRHLAESMLANELWIAAGFLVIGGMLIAAEQMGGLIERAGVKQASAVGFAQAMAIWPGISRSGVTSFAALATGMQPAAAFRYVFLCSIPALSAVSAYELYNGLRDRAPGEAGALSVSLPVLALCIVVSGVVGYFALKLLDTIFIKRRLAYFGAYVLGLAAMIFARKIILG